MKYEVKLPQNISIAGSTTSGKTHLTTTLIKEQLWSQLDVLIILSPTLHLSGDFAEFLENQNEKRGKLVYKFSKDFSTVINEVVEQQEGIIMNHSKKECPQVVIVLDDMVNNPLLRFRGTIDSLSTKSRHLNITLIILVQRITAIPRTFRLNTRTFITFNITEFSELERMLEGCVPKTLRKPLRDNIQDIFDVPYNYLLINCFSTRIRERLMLNGDEYLYESLMNAKHTIHTN